MTVEYGNIFYFLFIAVEVAIFVGLYFFLRKKSKRFVWWFLFAILMANFALHFIKLCAAQYRYKLPTLYRKITPENICAVSTLIYPFIFLCKNKTLRDYMFYVGTFSGSVATLLPTEALGFSPLSFDVIRFYVCHGVLWMVPLLMVIHGFHKLDYRRIWRQPFVFFFVLSIILTNEIILFRAGLLDDKFESLSDMFNPEIRNSAFIFGPTPAMEKLAVVVTALSPKFLMTNPSTGAPMYWPILWMVVPVFIYFNLVFFCMSLPWEYGRVKADVKTAIQKVKNWKAKRKQARLENTEQKDNQEDKKE